MPKAIKNNKASNKKTTVNTKPTNDNELDNKTKLRLGIGLFCLLAGAFISFAIISYFFSWQQDQQHLINNPFFEYINDKTIVAQNRAGRLGAALAHIFVYRGAGIASLLFSVWIAGIGWNLINDKNIFPARKWVRWMSFSIFFLCPVFALLFSKNSYPFGGALGNFIIDFTQGFAGTAGILLMLLIAFLFFAFIVFQWDIKPVLAKAKTLLPTKGELSGKTFAEELKEEAEKFKGFKNPEPIIDEEPATKVETTDAPQNIDEVAMSLHFADDTHEENEENIDLDVEDDALQLVIKSTEEESVIIENTTHISEPATNNTTQNTDTNTIITNKPEGIVLELPEQENNNPTTFNAPPSDDFEITTVENETAIPAHNSHISIGSNEPYDPSLELSDYKFPTLDLLDEVDAGKVAIDREELEQNKNQIINTLRSFGIEIQKISATVGPTVTLYEIVPAEGVRISKIRNLEDDIALNLAALGIRIIAPIPGKGTIGIEVPNTKKQIVPMGALLSSEKFVNTKMSLPIALGKKIDNENYIVDLATMPHLLMAGATGQGKSVGINAILVSLLYKKHPSQLKFVMVDPKKVELSVYRLIEKHFLAVLPNEEEPIITDTKKVVNTLSALCIEMDNRYELLKDAGARNIKEYNEKFIKRRLNPLQGHKYLPFIVLVIDEFADLIMTAGKEVEMPIARLAQLARAVGIHIIIATQRPSVNVITGIIKANFPARIAFKVSAKVDSRTILDASGADQLVGRGDMLVSHGSELLRLQCAFVDTPEVERIVAFIGNQRGYPQAFQLPEYEGAEDEKLNRESVDLSKKDSMFEECARLVVNSQSGSTSMLQRKFNLGYNRAGRIMDQLEAAGIVGPAQGSKPRDVIVTTEYELEKLLEELL